jgi:hypothetical protein
VRGKPKARLCPIAAAPGAAKRPARAWGKRLREGRSRYSVSVRDSGEEILDDLRGERD